MQDFYEDLFEELSKYGDLESLNICDNLADHMVDLRAPTFLIQSFVWMICVTDLFGFNPVVDRWAMSMFSLEKKSKLQMRFRILMDAFMQVYVLHVNFFSL